MSEPTGRPPGGTPLLTLPVRRGEDVVLARQRAREVAELAGFDPQDRTRVATAVSEIARTALQNAGGGEIAFALRPGGSPGGRPELVATVRETGPGRDDLRALLDGRAGGTARADGSGGLGPVAARRLMDGFAVEQDGGGGGVVRMTKRLPRGTPPPTPDRLAAIAAELARLVPADPVAELQRQNRELLDALAELRERQAELKRLNGELEQLNHELEETNRGVVALYAELDEKAASLRRASDLKSRFLSHMSHEFRSPLNSILSLVRILLDRGDGPLNPEQETQVGFIRQSADGLLALVDDLLDLAKVEAGKQTVRPERFEIGDLFGTLRGMFRPLLPDSPDGTVALIFDPAPAPPAPHALPALPALHTDQGKLAQILRNFLSNALKFTERGEVRVSARLAEADAGAADARVTVTVADTGAGIAAGELGHIFEEFSQVDGPAQRRVKGTGLGLPLSRGLAELLGGSIAVRSTPGEGSAFSVTIPCVYAGPDAAGPDEPAAEAPRDAAEAPQNAAEEMRNAAGEPPPPAPPRAPVLVIEDDPATRDLYEKHLEGSGFEAVGAGTVAEARAALRRFRPAAVLLDIVPEADSGWALLEELKREVATRHVPVLVLAVVDDRERAFTLGADDFRLKPVDRAWLLGRLDALAGPDRPGAGGSDGPRHGTALVIDDEPPARYLLRGLLEEAGWHVVDADAGEAGLALARKSPPDVIFLDLVMPDLTGFQVLDRLEGDDRTAGVPVVICSSRVLTAADRRRLAESSAVLLAKDPVSRGAALARLGEALERAGLTHGPARESVREPAGAR